MSLKLAPAPDYSLAPLLVSSRLPSLPSSSSRSTPSRPATPSYSHSPCRCPGNCHLGLPLYGSSTGNGSATQIHTTKQGIRVRTACRLQKLPSQRFTAAWLGRNRYSLQWFGSSVVETARGRRRETRRLGEGRDRRRRGESGEERCSIVSTLLSWIRGAERQVQRAGQATFSERCVLAAVCDAHERTRYEMKG